MAHCFVIALGCRSWDAFLGARLFQGRGARAALGTNTSPKTPLCIYWYWPSLSAAVGLKRPAGAVAAAPTAASKKAKMAPQPAAKEARDDVAQLLEDLALRGYCVQRGVVPREVAKQAAELVQSSVAAKQSC